MQVQVVYTFARVLRLELLKYSDVISSAEVQSHMVMFCLRPFLTQDSIVITLALNRVPHELNRCQPQTYSSQQA